jgi:hypothetical protein
MVDELLNATTIDTLEQFADLEHENSRYRLFTEITF